MRKKKADRDRDRGGCRLQLVPLLQIPISIFGVITKMNKQRGSSSDMHNVRVRRCQHLVNPYQVLCM